MNLARFVHGTLPATCGAPQACAAQLHDERLAGLALARLKSLDALPALQRALKPHAVQAAARDLAQEAVLREVLAATEGVSVLVIKGAATGPLLYDSGALRPRWDTDLLVDGWGAVDRVTNLLCSRGWRTQHQLPGKFARHAVALQRGAFESIDVHARACKRIRVARALPFAELWSHREESLGFATLSARHAWLLAATHLTAHHSGQAPPKVLLEDLVRLGRRMSDEGWEWIWDRALEAGLVSAVRHAVELIVDWEDAGCDLGFRRSALAASADESARFAVDFEAVLDDLDLLTADEALTYLQELLLPPQSYLLTQLGVARTRPTALLQGVRILRGLSPRRRRDG